MNSVQNHNYSDLKASAEASSASEKPRHAGVVLENFSVLSKSVDELVDNTMSLLERLAPVTVKEESRIMPEEGYGNFSNVPLADDLMQLSRRIILLNCDILTISKRLAL